MDTITSSDTVYTLGSQLAQLHVSTHSVWYDYPNTDIKVSKQKAVQNANTLWGLPMVNKK